MHNTNAACICYLDVTYFVTDINDASKVAIVARMVAESLEPALAAKLCPDLPRAFAHVVSSQAFP